MNEFLYSLLPVNLAKMKILAFADANRKKFAKEGDKESTIELVYNPADYNESFDLTYETEGRQAINVSSKATRYSYTNPADRTFTFIFDSTIQRKAVSSDSELTISDEIKKFKALCLDETGTNNQPNYLTLEWGGTGFTCRLKSLDIHYKMFNEHGEAIRAEVQASFINDDPPEDDEYPEPGEEVGRKNSIRSSIKRRTTL